MPLNINYEGTEVEQAKFDPILKAFLEMSPNDIETHIRNTSVDLNTSIDIVVIIAKLLKVAVEEIIELKGK